jgi:aspartate-semialdehyde dehydrogenase
MLEIVERRKFPVKSLKLLASSRSVGRKFRFKGEEIPVEELSIENDVLDDLDLILSSAGGKISKWFAPVAAGKGCVVVDNTSAFRMVPDVPLVVPEVNPHALAHHKGIIANPNCSTIQMVHALKPIYDAVGIKRIVVSTYQAASGAGAKAIAELEDQTMAWATGKQIPRTIFPKQLLFNVIPQIGQSSPFQGNGYTDEEMKMVNETRKILEDDSIRVSATTARVPVFYGHSEAVNVETKKKITAAEAKALLREFPGIIVVDDLDGQDCRYPVALDAAGVDETFVGRIREDISAENGLVLWIVADNIRKGAALNAVQIAEIMAQKKLIPGAGGKHPGDV